MPKAFSEREKDLIQSSLKQAGRELFTSYGLRKTNVEDLTRAAGISKGAFYLFYDSKEALYLEILQDFEAEFRQRIFAQIQRPDRPVCENFKEMLREAYRIWRDEPLLRQFNQEDYQTLMRRLPEGAVQNHFQQDERDVQGLLSMLQAMGVAVTIDSALLTDLFQGLFFISLHDKEMGPGYQRAMDVFIDLITDYVFSGKQA